MARLVICCDGTWNSPEQEVNGLPSPTNVVRLKACLAKVGPDETAQQAYYRYGVGTSGSWPRRLREGGLGIGLGEDIKSAYHWLATTWKLGDSVRRLPAGSVWDTPLPRTLDLPIRFLGVWDTVGALGIPQDFGINVLRRVRRYRFHDTQLGSAVQTARHALAIDERRQSFSPTLWQGHEAGRDVRQLWFPGVHADVGGGYRERGIGDISLQWMIDEATLCGLGFDAQALAQIAPDARGAPA